MFSVIFKSISKSVFTESELVDQEAKINEVYYELKKIESLKEQDQFKVYVDYMIKQPGLAHLSRFKMSEYNERAKQLYLKLNIGGHVDLNQNGEMLYMEYGYQVLSADHPNVCEIYLKWRLCEYWSVDMGEADKYEWCLKAKRINVNSWLD